MVGSLLEPGARRCWYWRILRKGETFAELAAGSGISTTTAAGMSQRRRACWPPGSPKLGEALRQATKAGHACVVIDGTLIPQLSPDARTSVNWSVRQ